MRSRSAAPPILTILAVLLPGPARATDCQAILSSQDPFVMRGTSVALVGGSTRSTAMEFRVARGDETKVTLTIGQQTEPVIEFSYKGVLTTRIMVLRTKEVTEYEYASIDGALTPGTEMRYARVAKKNGEVASAETGLLHIGEAGTFMIGDCAIEVIEVKGEVKSDKAPERALTMLYAPKLGVPVKSTQGGLGPKGDIVSSFAASSLELAH
jgi:hypothetical protein